AVLGLALIENTISPDDAFTASRLDETYQSELWGVDAEAAEREKNLYREFNDIIRFLTLSRT
ncbi:MAG: ATPase, partial [Pseudomonadota bacterium]